MRQLEMKSNNNYNVMQCLFVLCQDQLQYMSKSLIPVLTIATVSSLAYLLRKYLSEDKNIMDRAQLVQIIITLRKQIFSTLREIAYVANCIKIVESGIEARKIKDITMKDGATAQKKLQGIEELVLERYDVTRQKFEQSCNYHSYNDIEVKILLQNFQTDIQNAIDGTVESYHGTLPRISSAEAVNIYREITLRRMRVIEEKFLNGLKFEIEQYLEGVGITHPKQSSEKVFIALLEFHYKTDSVFKTEFEALEKQFEDFIEEVKKKKEKKNK